MTAIASYSAVLRVENVDCPSVYATSFSFLVRGSPKSRGNASVPLLTKTAPHTRIECQDTHEYIRTFAGYAARTVRKAHVRTLCS